MSIRFYHRNTSNGPVLEGMGLTAVFLAVIVAVSWPLVVFADSGAAVGLWIAWLALCTAGVFVYGVIRHGKGH